MIFSSCTWFHLPQNGEGVSKVRLPNGLTVFLKEDRLKPRIGISTLIPISASTPTAKELLYAKTFQKLLLRGSDPYYMDSHKLTLQTSLFGNYLTIDLEGPSSKKEVAVEILFDLLSKPYLDPTKINKVTHNIKIKNYNDFFSFTEKVFLGKERYSDKEIENINLQNLTEFYKEKFTSKNITLSFVGDFNAKRLLRFIEKRATHLQQGEAPLLGSPSSSSNIKAQAQITPKHAELIISFIGPEKVLKLKTSLALHILKQAFLKNLSKTDIAIETNTFELPLGNNTLYGFQFGLNGEDVLKAHVLLFATIEQLKKAIPQSIYDGGLESFLKEYESLGSSYTTQAREIALLSATKENFQNIKDVFKTPSEDFKKLYETYFHIKNTIPSYSLIESTIQTQVEKTNLKLDSETAFTPSTKNFIRFKNHKNQEKINVEQFTLSNQLKLVILTEKSLDYTYGTILFKNLSTHVSQNFLKTFLLTLTQSTKTFDAHTLQEELTRLHVTLKPVIHPQYLGYSFSLPENNIKEFIFLLSDIFLHPHFTKQNVENAKKYFEATNSYFISKPSSLLHEMSFSKIKVEENFDEKDFAGFYEKNIFAQNTLVCFTGNMTSLKAKSHIEEYFQKMSQNVSQKESFFPPSPPLLIRESSEHSGARYLHLSAGFPVSVKNPSSAPLFGYLTHELEQNHPHFLNSYFFDYPEDSLFAFEFISSEVLKKTVLKQFQNTIKNLYNKKLPQKEWTWIKNRFLTKKEYMFSNSLKRPLFLSKAVLFDLPLNPEKYTQLLSYSETLKLIEEYLHPDKFYIGSTDSI
ncbi:MAG: insulinase family protein [Deltaproteobacteria bacterium]|nr:insulinase family protein [Deltaproteobacteria bacterium]